MKEIIEEMTIEDYLEKGVYLTEIEGTSNIHMKKIKEDHDRRMCLL